MDFFMQKKYGPPRARQFNIVAYSTFDPSLKWNIKPYTLFKCVKLKTVSN